MAEIKIEKKKNNWLPWLLGILGLVLLAWLAVDFFDKDGEPELLTADEVNFPDGDLSPRPDNDRLNAQVNERYDDVAYDGSDVSFDQNFTDFKNYLNEIDHDDAEMDVHHDYSNKSLRALANSIDALAKEKNYKNRAEVNAATKKIRNNAEQITKNWKAGNHADLIKAAALEAVDVLSSIQKENYPNLGNDVNELREAANDINKRTLTLDQKEDVKDFFEEAADLLEKMRK